jgi:hypothetical protein
MLSSGWRPSVFCAERWHAWRISAATTIVLCGSFFSVARAASVTAQNSGRKAPVATLTTQSHTGASRSGDSHGGGMAAWLVHVGVGMARA